MRHVAMDSKGDRMTSDGKRANGEFVTGAITGAAILLFVATGGAALSSAMRDFLVAGEQFDHNLGIAAVLNIALILFGWHRHRVLTRAVDEGVQSGRMGKTDPLTGFLSRRSLCEEGADMLVQAGRRRKAMALLMLDLDHFKTVNDMHGHATGDALLREVAACIGGAMPPVALTARLGGDEFACGFLFDPTHPDTVDRIAEQLLIRLALPFEAEGVRIHVGASIGVARSDLDCQSIESLIRAADIAMYAAKAAGRSRHSWFDRSMERELQARNELEVGLRGAIPRGEIVPYFEQQIDLLTGRLTGFEVLARWEHPQRGLVSPELFIPIAEETGLIAELSLSIMHQAFLAARDWDASLTLSVNVSPWQLKDAWLAQKIIKALTETGFPASRLEIEITESSLFENLPLAQSIIGSLKNQGIRIALDDFGTGYSSLAHLRALPFDRIKIDKGFVQSINDNPESAAIVTAIAGLGESLNLAVTAEGIEDAAVEARMRALGCAKGQGYFYGRPVNATAIRRLLAERRLLAQAPLAPGPVMGNSHRATG